MTRECFGHSRDYSGEQSASQRQRMFLRNMKAGSPIEQLELNSTAGSAFSYVIREKTRVWAQSYSSTTKATTQQFKGRCTAPLSE